MSTKKEHLLDLISQDKINRDEFENACFQGNFHNRCMFSSAFIKFCVKLLHNKCLLWLERLKISNVYFKTIQRFPGIPDGCGIRSTCWKILLNYLPYEKTDWKDVLDKQRNAYTQFIKTMIVDPNNAGDGHDHPLSSSPTSIWTGFFKENEVCTMNSVNTVYTVHGTVRDFTVDFHALGKTY